MLIIFDKDGTLIGNFNNRPANSIEEQQLLPGVAEKCAELRAQGHDLAVASNQGGVAYGLISQDEAAALVAHAAGLIGSRLFLFCPHHPKGANPHYAIECDCRKPRPGMLLQLMWRAKAAPADTIMVGDSESDRQAAEAAGVAFAYAKDFFKKEN